MKTRKTFLTLTSLVFVVAGAHAQQLYTLSNSSTTLYRDRNGIALDNQTPTTPGNGQGQLIQLGFFSTATDANLFSGTFTSLASFNSGDSASGTTNVPNGRLSLSVQFDTSLGATKFPGGATQSTSTLSSYPAAGTPLAIRFFDTVTTSAFYNTVSATNWDFVTPTAIPAPGITFNPDPASFPVGLAFEFASSPLQVVPEPSTYALTGLGGIAFFVLRGPRKVS